VSIRRRETKTGVRYHVDWQLPDGSKRITWKTERKKLLAAGPQAHNAFRHQDRRQ
jgi:hypothetical protein